MDDRTTGGGLAAMTNAEADDVEVYEPTRLLEALQTDWRAPQGDLPTHVPLASLEALPELFQPRGLSEKHISDLKRAIKSNGSLDAIVVLPVGQRLIIIDGHHRHEAYQQSHITASVPVEYFRGSPRQAVFEAGMRNSKAKLSMDGVERQNFAWRLVLLDHGSKEEISSAAGVAKSQVGNMRVVKRALEESAYDYHQSWRKASAAAQGKSKVMDDDDAERFKDQQAADWADRLAREFSTKLATHPEIAALALDLYFGRKLPDLVTHLRSLVPADDHLEGDF